MKDYEEYHEWSTGKSWLFIILQSSFLLVMASLMMFLIEDVPREWNFGNVEFTPAKSVYSTHNPEVETTEKMVTPLPEGVTMEEEINLKPKNSED